MPGFEQLRGSGAPTSHRVSRLLMQLVPLVPAADLAEQQREKQEKQKGKCLNIETVTIPISIDSKGHTVLSWMPSSEGESVAN